MAGRNSSLPGSAKRRLGFWARAGIAGVGVAAIAGGAFLAGTSGRPSATHSSPQQPSPRTHMRLAAAPLNNQYWMAASDGGVFSEGGAPFWGSEGYHTLNQPVVGMAASPSGKGYWMVARDGGIFTEGQIGFYGSMAGRGITAPIVGMATTPDGGGYWLVGSDGHVYAMGDAGDFGGQNGTHLNKPIVGMAPTPDGGGYWLVASDGGIFTHGDAPYLGGEGWHPLNKPVVGMAASPDGKGYWLVASDGGVFTEGSIGYYGSEGWHPLNQPVVGMAATPTGHGYWLVASDGGIFTEGPDAGFGGSEGYHHLNQPVVAMAATPELFSHTLSLTSSAGTLVADGVSTSTITAVVTDSSGNRIPGRTVAFSVTTAGCGTLSSAKGVTDLTGAVSTVYRASGTVAGCSVHAADVNAPVANTTVINQVVGSPMHIAVSPSGTSSPTADAGNTGIPVTFTVTDAHGHPVPSVTLDLTTTLGSGSVPASGATNSSGVLQTSLTDTLAYDSGVVTATVDTLPAVHISTGTITIQPGAVHQLSASGSVPDQTAGAGYTLAIDAVDTFGNPTNPSTSSLSLSGGALDAALDTAGTPALATWEPAGFVDGEALLDVTSYNAEQQVVLTVTDNADNTINASTNQYNVGAGPFAVLVKPAVGAQTAGQGYTVPVDATDQWANPVNPNTSDLTVSGSALDTARDTTTHATDAWEPAGFVNGEALLDVTSYKAESAGLTITDTNDSSITTSTDAYTVNAGPFKLLAKPSVGTQTATVPYTVAVDATDQWLNPVNPNTSDLTVTGSALDASPNAAHTGTATWEPAGFVGGEAVLDVTSYKAEQAVLTVTDNADNTITTSTDAYTVNPTAFSALSLSAPTPTSPTAGSGYTLTLAGLDSEGNHTAPPGGTIQFSGTALDVAPDGDTTHHTGTAAEGTFTNGVATVTATAYKAGADNLKATYTNGGTSFDSNTRAYTVAAATYSRIIPSYGGASPYIRVDSGSTPTLVITQPPTGTPAPTAAQVTLAPVDAYQNAVSTTDSLTTALSPDTATTPDAGTLAGGAPPTADFVLSNPVTITAAESYSSNSASFTYNPPATIPASGFGTITTTDVQNNSIVLTMHVVVTTVAHVAVQSTLTCTTCAAGTVDHVTYLAQDANGGAVSGAWLDLSRQGLANAVVAPSSPAQTDGNGLLAATVTDNKAPETGDLAVGVHDVPSSDVNLVLTSATINYQVGAPSQLWISTSNSAGGYNAGGPTSEAAGVGYQLYVWSLDSFANPVNPTGAVTVSGSALDNVAGGGSSSSTLGTFSNGIATLNVTSAKVNATATLTPAASCGSPCSANQVTFAINPGSPATVTGSLSPAGGTYTADQGHTGIQANFLVADSEGNPVPSVVLDMSKSAGLTGALGAAQGTTGSSGLTLGIATVTLTDTTAGDTGTVTGTVHSNPSVLGSTPTITITPGAIHTLTLGATGTQVAGAAYTVAVTAKDAYLNPVNPSWLNDLTLSGRALDNSPLPAMTQPVLSKPNFAGGTSTMSITSYLAQTSGPSGGDQLDLACTAAAVTSGVCDNTNPTSSVNFAISAATASQIVVRDTNSNVASSVAINTPAQAVSLTVKREDPYNNVAASQSGTVRITLTPGSTPDNGFLSGGGNFTPVDTAAPQHLDLNLSSSTAFTYTAPGSLPGTGTGTMTYTDLTLGNPSNPGQTTITD